jgi:gliding motility-associated-like protein
MDNKLRNILNDKLDGYESHVPETLWNRMEANLSSSAAPAQASVLTKWIVGLAFVATSSFGLLWMNSSPNKVESLHPSETTVILEKPVADSTRAAVESNSASTPGKHVATVITQVASTKENIKTQAQPTDTATMSELPPNLETKTEQRLEKSDSRETLSTIASEKAHGLETTSASDFSFAAVPVNEYDLTYFFMPAKTDAERYSWDFGDGTTSSESAPLHTYEKHGTYEVSLVMNTSNETHTRNLKLECFPLPHWEAPTIFTPNGDGKNDVFDLTELSKNIEITEIAVFDEDGNRIYHSGFSGSWDGTRADGSAADEGYYTYHAQGRDLRQQIVEKNGRIYLKL